LPLCAVSQAPADLKLALTVPVHLWHSFRRICCITYMVLIHVHRDACVSVFNPKISAIHAMLATPSIL
jgi:hypothetical protein